MILALLLLPAATVAETPLCYLGCFTSGDTYMWDGCTLENSRPQCEAPCPGRACLYLHNARLKPNPANPILRQCEAACRQKGFMYMAVNDGTACYCGRGHTGADSMQPDSNCQACPDLPDSKCGLCGHHSGNPAYRIAPVGATSCPFTGTALGWDFSALLLGLGFVYLSVGTILKHRRTGLRGWQALPHRTEWQQLHSIVCDGVRFTLRGGGGGGGDGGGGGGVLSEALLGGSIGNANSTVRSGPSRGGGGSASSGSSSPVKLSSQQKGKKKEQQKQQKQQKQHKSRKKKSGEQSGDEAAPASSEVGATGGSVAVQDLGRQQTEMTDVFGRTLTR